MKKEIQLEDWFFIKTKLDGKLNVGGRVFGDSRFKDGFAVVSSPIVSINRDEMKVETQNTIYVLGKVSPAYKAFLSPIAELTDSPVFVGKSN